MTRRIPYAGSVHDDREVDAVVEVLHRSLRIGRNVSQMEAKVSALFGKQLGLMCNSGSSALYLAVELLDLPPGAEVITPVLTFSTTVAPIVRAGLVPAFVDVQPDTYNIDVDAIEEMVTPRTRAMVVPNLVGNVPDWDRIREIADRHGLALVEDSADALGATLRGTPTGRRSDISTTSFAMSHVITCAGNGGMVMTDDEALRDRGLLLRRWGRSSEVQLYGSRRGDTRFLAQVDGMEYDSLFVFEELGWNFEPSELGAAFGLAQLTRLDGFLATRQRHFRRHTDFFSGLADRFVLPRQTPEVVTGWLSYPIIIGPEAGFSRATFQAFLEERGVETRMVWSGNILRQPAFKGIASRSSVRGYPNADRVMEGGLILPCNHGLGDDDVGYIHEVIDAFIATV